MTTASANPWDGGVALSILRKIAQEGNLMGYVDTDDGVIDVRFDLTTDERSLLDRLMTQAAEADLCTLPDPAREDQP